MPTVFDTKFRALATKLVTKFGITNGTYTKITHGTMNDDTNKVEGGSVTANVIPMSPPIRYNQTDVDGTLIRSDDYLIYIPAPDFEDAFGASAEIETVDFIEVDSRKLRIINTDPIYSGEQIAVYKLQVRNAQDAV